MMWGEFHIENGVCHWGAIPLDNQQAYQEARQLEGRVLSDQEVLNLPVLPKRHPLAKEWLKRRDTASRFVSFLKMNGYRSALEIGCGNGWFCNLMAQIPGMEQVVGLDVNQPELEQAARVFPDTKIKWFLSDIFQWDAKNIQFDLIVLNASIQYFPDLERLLKQCKRLLHPGGALHILDSPFYHTEEMVAAQTRSQSYYTQLGVPKMAVHYHHHSWDAVEDLEVLYRPNRSLIRSLFWPNASPFPWLCYQKRTL